MARSAELEGLRVLVVEDEFLVAMDIEAMLHDLGCEVMGPTGDLENALRIAREETLNLALLDVNIGGEPVTGVAEVLVARAVPIVFCTGYQGENWCNRYPAVPTLMKPFQPADLRAALERALASGNESS
ncbi:MAG TPA: response regulator [Geminicoccaceae bacterium]|nr:response regulator [Geminicoccaceae bacterium]